VLADAKRGLKTAFGHAAGLTGLYARQLQSKMLVVAFHRVTDALPGDPITCSSAKFESFCRFFMANFRVVPLYEQIAGGLNGSGMGGTLSITFDDGYRNNHDVAAPILRRLNLPATFFVTTGFVGTQVVPSWDRHLSPPPRWMDWDELRSLASQGFEIGSHTHTHIDLATAEEATIREELATSQRRLLEELGKQARLFAYPFGGRANISASARQLVREAGFICCAACCGGVNALTVNPFELQRIGIADWFSTPQQFGFEVLTGKA
jgi:peptidoglycan/xylan/chitin deacetylase (PgdA/CDA1 family)